MSQRLRQTRHALVIVFRRHRNFVTVGYVLAGVTIAGCGRGHGEVAGQGVIRLSDTTSVLGCSPADRDTGSAKIRDSAGVSVVENPAGATVEELRIEDAPEVTFGDVDSLGPGFIARVGDATRLLSREVAVVDSHPGRLHIMVYDSAGRFLRQIGRHGRGPGEFLNVARMLALRGDTLVVQDEWARRVTFLSAKGRVLRVEPTKSISYTVNAPSRSAIIGSFALVIQGRFADGSYLAIANTESGHVHGDVQGAGVKTQAASLYHLTGFSDLPAPLGTILRGEEYHYVWPGGKAVMRDWHPFGKRSAIAVGDSGFFIGTGRSYEIEYRLPTNETKRIIRLCQRPAVLTDDEIGRYRTWASAKLPAGEIRGDWGRVFAGIPYPTVRPEFDVLRLDGRGRLWVRDYVPEFAPAPWGLKYMLDSGGQRWHVFGRDGLLLARVRLASGVQVLEIGRDYLMGKVVNEDGIESVKSYRLPKFSSDAIALSN
jgi:hypothetical protein